MNSYEAKQAARKARFEERAEQASAESASTYNRARDMAQAIPFGQPILVGHHSETRDRNYRDRIHTTYGKAFALQDKAKHYEQKAASVGTGGISSDDPDAIEKLRAELANVEQAQERREAKDQERLERHGQAAALASQNIEAEQPKAKQAQGFELDAQNQDSAEQRNDRNEINGQQAKALAKELNRDNENGDQVKQARAREIAERFKEKAARAREQERGFSR